MAVRILAGMDAEQEGFIDLLPIIHNLSGSLIN